MKLRGCSSRKYRCQRKKRSLSSSKSTGRNLRKTKNSSRVSLTCDGDGISARDDSRRWLIEETDATKKTYDAVNTEGRSREGEKASLLSLQDLKETPASPKRWNALILFCALIFAQCCIGNTWGPIATSAMLAFPSWKKSFVALLSNWGCITYLSCCLPSCWFLNRKGLQAPLRTAAVISTIATFIRCITSQEKVFTISVHTAAILNGIAGVIISPAAALVSATWFPPGERTTATGISACFNQLGVAGSYLIGPGIVAAPSIPKPRISSVNEGVKNGTESSLIRAQIMTLTRVEFSAHLFILVGFFLFFPANLQSQQIRPGSRGGNHYGLLKSLRYLIHNKSVWQLCGAAALSQGVTGPWLAMITLAFDSSVTQAEADRLAFWTVILGSILGVSASRLMDIFQGYLKPAIFVLLVSSSVMFLWILLLDTRVLNFDKRELYAAVAVGVSSSWATPALFLELASEIAFPVSEAIVGGYMIFLANFVGAIFYFSYFIPDMSERWSTYWLFGSQTIASILIFYLKEEYNRTLAIREVAQSYEGKAVRKRRR